MHLYITVPSSYFRFLGGLCGNYNGDRGDDRTSPLNTILPTVLEFAKSWKGDDKDRFCNDDCKGSCPECSPQLQKRYGENEFCGILTKTDGPFASCHKALDPSIFFANCIFDVCINKGARMFFCDNLKLYDDACLAKGVKISPQWRMNATCRKFLLFIPSLRSYVSSGWMVSSATYAPNPSYKLYVSCPQLCSVQPTAIMRPVVRPALFLALI